MRPINLENVGQFKINQINNILINDPSSDFNNSMLKLNFISEWVWIYTLYDEGIKIIVRSLKICMLAGACRKIHPTLKEYEFEVAVATILKHAPNKQMGGLPIWG